ncbi:hypothetical protein HMPREF9455_03811, partial [Dysgonomonas gadei ATCC BAA-286]
GKPLYVLSINTENDSTLYVFILMINNTSPAHIKLQ